MAAIASSTRLSAAAPRVARKAAVTGLSRPVARQALRVRASAQKEAAVSAGVAAGVVAVMANPLVAQAAVTPSLQNFFYSLVAGGVVLAGIAGAVTLVSNFDPVSRD